MKKFLINIFLAILVNLSLFSHLNAQEPDSRFSEVTVKNVQVVQPQKEKKKKKDKNKNETGKSETSAANQSKSRLFNVISYDSKNEIVRDLNIENYKVFVNDGEKKIDTFKSFKNGMNIVLMFDNSNSGSIEGDIVKTAFINFTEKIRPQDRLYLVVYDENVRLLAIPDFDRQKVRKSIEDIKSGGGTSLYDAVDFVFSKVLVDTDVPSAVFLLTDGVDTTSKKNKFQSVLQKAENYNAVFSVIYQDTFAEFTAVPKINPPLGTTLRRSPKTVITGVGVSKEEYAQGVFFLNSLASSTGGRVMSATSTVEEYKKAFETIYEEFQNMNSLGFESGDADSAGIKIRINRPDLKIITNNRLVFEDK